MVVVTLAVMRRAVLALVSRAVITRLITAATTPRMLPEPLVTRAIPAAALCRGCALTLDDCRCSACETSTLYTKAGADAYDNCMQPDPELCIHDHQLSSYICIQHQAIAELVHAQHSISIYIIFVEPAAIMSSTTVVPMERACTMAADRKPLITHARTYTYVSILLLATACMQLPAGWTLELPIDIGAIATITHCRC